MGSLQLHTLQWFEAQAGRLGYTTASYFMGSYWVFVVLFQGDEEIGTAETDSAAYALICELGYERHPEWEVAA